MTDNNRNEQDYVDSKTEINSQTDKKSSQPAQTDGQGEAKNFTLMFIALGCLVVGAIIFALSFFIKGAGVYLIIASMIFALACSSFLNGQKRRAYSNACKVIMVLSYALMIACVAVVLTGTVMNSQQ